MDELPIFVQKNQTMNRVAYFILIAVFSLVAFTSCQKDVDAVLSKTGEWELNDWSYIAFKNYPNGDVVIDQREIADAGTAIFNANGTGTISVENDNVPDDTFSWSATDSEVTITKASTGVQQVFKALDSGSGRQGMEYRCSD